VVGFKSFLKLPARVLERRERGIMKNKQFFKTISTGVSHLRIAVASVLVLGAAALAAIMVNPNPPKLPWAAPIINVGQPGDGLAGVAVDRATNTIYVASGNYVGNSVIAVIDGSRCNEHNASHCSVIGAMSLGASNFAIVILFDQTTNTLYVPVLNDNSNTIAVFDTRTCNAKNLSGCSQTPATTAVPGVLIDFATALLALDPATHSLYVGDANDGPVSVVNTATCNGTITSGCSQPATATSTNGDSITVDPSNHSVYAGQILNGLVSVFDGRTCSGDNTSGCGQPPSATFAVDGSPSFAGAIDNATHTFYLPLGPTDLDFLFFVPGHVAVIDTSTCNATITSCCGNTTPMVPTGTFPDGVILDPETHSVYFLNQSSAKISMFNGATCNAINHSGCGQTIRQLATGVVPDFFDLNPTTHTFYVQSEGTNTVWVLDQSRCNAQHTEGCTDFAQVTTVGVGPLGLAANPNTHTAYEANQTENTVSVIDTSVCNASNTSGCSETWATIPLGNTPRFIGINKITNTIYVSNAGDNTLSVIDGSTCNGSNTSGCSQPQPTTTVGGVPQQIAVDEINNTIYVANQAAGTVSVINGTHCNGTDTSGCHQSWPIVTVGNAPWALGLNPSNHTVYVTNLGDNTVSVIDGNRCNGTNSSGCGQTPPVVTVGNLPWSVGIVTATNTIFVGNRNDLTVSVIDGSTCNGTNSSGCGQTPPAVLVGAFPDTAGIEDNILGRSIAVDPSNHKIYIPVLVDSDVAELDANACRVGHVDGCHVKIVKQRMGGFPGVAAVDESSETVYVSNNRDGTISLFSADAPRRARPMRRER
jgi:DNA-binding beta-propeller fold protein YncE